MGQPLGFLEPLRKMVSTQGDRLQEQMGGVRTTLDAIKQNTEAQFARDQSTRKSVRVAPGKTEQLRNDGAYGWRIKWVANLGGGEVRIFLGVESPEGFMLELENRGSERVEWYLPLNGVIFVTNTEEAPGEGETFVNFEVDVLMTEAQQAFTGSSGEHIDVQRREPTPSGTPLDTPVATDPPGPPAGINKSIQ